jgi:4-hydroxythreonine-4-phosphate dehydrogenase
MRKPLILSLTSGDIDGIGYEVSVKALIKYKLPKNQRLILWRSQECLKKYSKLLKKNINTQSFYDLDEALNYLEQRNSTQVVELISNESPALWVEKSAQYCLMNKLDALVTGPISKKILYSYGHKDMGHTGLLTRVSNSNEVFMTFLGKKFNILCITGHLPISSVEKNLSSTKIKSAINLALNLRLKLQNKKKDLPIAILGLNPHASEEGLIGSFDLKLNKLISTLPNSHYICGPLVPDAAFFKMNWSKYSIFICLYHDQGLIPFKMIHGQNSGVQYSLGLPFTRTSVDHGTAKDIFNLDIANCNSMIDALTWASRLIESY